METTNYQATKKEKELIKIHNKKVKKRKSNREKNLKMNKMMTKTVTVIFDRKIMQKYKKKISLKKIKIIQCFTINKY